MCYQAQAIIVLESKDKGVVDEENEESVSSLMIEEEESLEIANSRDKLKLEILEVTGQKKSYSTLHLSQSPEEDLQERASNQQDDDEHEIMIEDDSDDSSS